MSFARAATATGLLLAGGKWSLSALVICSAQNVHMADGAVISNCRSAVATRSCSDTFPNRPKILRQPRNRAAISVRSVCGALITLRRTRLLLIGRIPMEAPISSLWRQDIDEPFLDQPVLKPENRVARFLEQWCTAVPIVRAMKSHQQLEVDALGCKFLAKRRPPRSDPPGRHPAPAPVEQPSPVTERPVVAENDANQSNRRA